MDGMNRPNTNEDLKQVLKNLHAKIAKDVNPDSVIDVLLSKHIISDDDYYDLRQVRGCRDRCRDLLSLLYLSSHPDTFVQLRLALLDEYPWIVDEIDEQLTSLTVQQQHQKRPSTDSKFQGCSLGLERLGLEAVSRRFLERLGLVSVSRVWKNRTSRSHFGLEGSTSRSRLGLEDITSRSRDFSLVNIMVADISRRK